MRKSRFWMWVLPGSVFLAACGSDPAGPSSTSLSSGTISVPNTGSVDINSLLAGTSASVALSTVSLASIGKPPYTCPYDAGTEMFVCPPSSVGGMGLNTSYQLLDAASKPQSSYQSTSIAAIRTVRDATHTVSGTTSAGSYTITTSDHHDYTVSGLLTGNPVLNGSGSTRTSMSGSPITITFGLDRRAKDVVLPRVGSRWPQSGSVIIENYGSGGITSTTTISFNGTSTINVVITNVRGTVTCTVDAETIPSTAKCS